MFFIFFPDVKKGYIFVILKKYYYALVVKLNYIIEWKKSVI
jgi:hypothetical protein